MTDYIVELVDEAQETTGQKIKTLEARRACQAQDLATIDDELAILRSRYAAYRVYVNPKLSAT